MAMSYLFSGRMIESAQSSAKLYDSAISLFELSYSIVSQQNSMGLDTVSKVSQLELALIILNNLVELLVHEGRDDEAQEVRRAFATTFSALVESRGGEASNRTLFNDDEDEDASSYENAAAA